MKAKALICDASQKFSVQDVVLRDPGPGDLVVRTTCSGVSIGTEFALVRNKLFWGPYPLCTGYMAVGIVERVGTDVEGFAPGDAVYFNSNGPMKLASGEDVSSVSGTHSSAAVLTPGGAGAPTHLPEGVDDEVGCFFVVMGCGLEGTDLANPRVGDLVVIHGVGLIGLSAVAAVVPRGARVVAVDLDDGRLEAAAKLGAEYRINASRQDTLAEIQKLAPEGADVVFEASGIPACLDTALALCKPRGTFVWQGNYGEKPISFHFLVPHGKHLNMVFPCGGGGPASFRAVLRNAASGTTPWQHTITHRVPWEESPALFEAINAGTAEGVIGALVRWS